ncbi:MAG: ABC exporter membrane fusion protein [Cyanobacteria bacterium P01_F01_bin.150]
MASRWLIAGTVALMGSGAVALWRMQAPVVQNSTRTVVDKPIITTVTALGRLEPQGETIQLSAPSSSQGQRVERLMVQEGDRVDVGQVIAVMDSHNGRKAALEEAIALVEIAQSQLAVVQAGAKQGEINAQRAEIARLEADYQGEMAAQQATVARLQTELNNAEVDYRRFDSLYQEGAIAESERDRQRLARDTANERVQEAQAVLARLQSASPQTLSRARSTLDQIAEVRPVDIQVAQAEVSRAIAARNQAQANFDQTLVRSPMAGEVLDIHTRAGEVISTEGIVELGQTGEMMAIAEVYQSDIGRVQPGQSVRVTSRALPDDLTGTVERIGAQVLRQTIVNTDPSSNIDARVVEVHVRLDEDSSRQAASFTNLQVQVVIDQDSQLGHQPGESAS